MHCKNEGIDTIYNMLKNPKTPKIPNDLYRTENNKIIGTCAFGEIGLQLHMKNFYIDDVTTELVKLGVPKQLIDDDGAILRKSIMNWNNFTNLTKPQIAEKIKKQFGDVE